MISLFFPLTPQRAADIVILLENDWYGEEEGYGGDNKHFEFLVSCSDEERNCIQAHETACKLMELHVSSWNCMQAEETACKLMDLHASLCNSMQAYVTACKLL